MCIFEFYHNSLSMKQTKKHNQFEYLKSEIEEILYNSSTIDDKLSQICNILYQKVSYYNWVGYYFHVPGKQELQLKTFAGAPTEHTSIPFGKGICGQVAVSNQSFLVPDVTAQDNYIACSIDVKSEIVVPLFVNGKNIGQIDIDSHTANAFSTEDQDFLEWINRQVAKMLL